MTNANVTMTQILADRIGLRVSEINPHDGQDPNLGKLYEIGLLRAILAQCMLQDNKNEVYFNRVIRALKDLDK